MGVTLNLGGLTPNGAKGSGLGTWTLQKTGGVHGDWDVGAVTSQSFASTVQIEATVDGTTTVACGIGLSADNPDGNYTGIDFMLLQDGATLYKSENGALTSLGVVAATDVLKIVRTMPGGAVEYFKNGVSLNVSSNTSTAALIGDSSFRFSNNSLSSVKITAGALQPVTWSGTGMTCNGV
jgi:hypothetical protein